MARKRIPDGFRKRGNGLLEYRFCIDEERYSVYGKTVKECREKELLKRQDVAKGIERRKNPTVKDYATSWLEHRKLQISENTYRAQKQILDTVGKIVLENGVKMENMRLCEVNSDDLYYIQSNLLKSRRTRTVNDYMALLRHVFSDACKERRIEYNPTDPVKPLKITEEQARDTIHRALTIAEQQAFFDCDRAKTSHYYNVFRMAVLTGMRSGEIGALKYRDIRKNEIHVERTITRTETGAYCVGESTKTASGRRVIPITPKIAKIITEQKKINVALYGNVTGLDDLLFRAPMGGLLMATPADREIKQVCKKIKIEPFTMHAFRATFATRAIEGGMNPRTLQELLGHSNFNLTMSLYGHALPNTLAEEMGKIAIMC